MGREARVTKQRDCQVCAKSGPNQGLMNLNSKALRLHARICRRMDEAGLVMPDSQRIIQP